MSSSDLPSASSTYQGSASSSFVFGESQTPPGFLFNLGNTTFISKPQTQPQPSQSLPSQPRPQPRPQPRASRSRRPARRAVAAYPTPSLSSVSDAMSKVSLSQDAPPEDGQPDDKNPRHITPDAASSASSSDQPASDDDDASDSDGSVDPTLAAHLRLLQHHGDADELDQLSTAPIFTQSVREYADKKQRSTFSQFGLLAGVDAKQDPRLFYNVAAPSSVFICGSQGSGKSHSLSCLLENCLVPSPANQLPRPLTGIVFHYDPFFSDGGGGAPCEAAWLASSRHVQVRVLCAPSNVRTMRQLYHPKKFPGVVVEELRLRESDLDTKRMLDLMAVPQSGNMPLYLHVVNRVLRDQRISQQRTGAAFDYAAFKRAMQAEKLTREQNGPLQQRLDTLESFMQVAKDARDRGGRRGSGTDWTPQPGRLTIVDLSCPCVTAETACSLFNICLGLFLEQPADRVGRVAALDEAHKYMGGTSAECQALTASLLAVIRLQRHLGARVVISTQEPTVSPHLLDLCSVAIVHRFSSPAWLAALRAHLAGGNQRPGGDEDSDLFSHIVALRVGEALLFAPSAVVGVDSRVGRPEARRLGSGVLKVRIRQRVTSDGGRSVMA